MSRPSVLQNERLVELLVQRASERLSAAEQAELAGLLAAKQYVDAGLFDEAAAALDLASGAEPETLPDSVKARVLRQAEIEPTLRGSRGGAPSRSWFQPGRWGWAVAAASVLLAVAAWWPRLQGDGGVDFITAASPDSETLQQRREALLARQGTLLRKWKTTEDPAAAGVSGDVIWHSGIQMGYMRFRGLTANDAQVMQYQLWIFDATRGDRYPVDGGVFNIPAGQSEVVVPIIAKLPVRSVALFAVTIEKPGGAVVSSREHIVVVAPVSSPAA